MKKKILIVFGTRLEVVEAGTIKLLGTYKILINKVNELITYFNQCDAMSKTHNPY